MGCGSSGPKQEPAAAGPKKKAKKKKDKELTNIVADGHGDFQTPDDRGKKDDDSDAGDGDEKGHATTEMKKMSINPNSAAHVKAATVAASTQGAKPAANPLADAATPPTPTASGAAAPAADGAATERAPSEQKPAAKSQPVQMALDPTKKINLRQTIQMALQIAKQQRERFGKFRRDERHGVMELYEVMGLDNDTPLAPPSEYQLQLAAYRYPPDNMHMLRDVEKLDEETLEFVLGKAEAKRRREAGTVQVMLDPKGAAKDRRSGVSGEANAEKKARNQRDAFKVVQKTQDQTRTLQAALLKNTLFKGLDSTELRMLFEAFQEEKFQEGTPVFEKGDDGDKFYLIETGRCQIILTDDDGMEKGSVYVGDGDTFGELGVMYGTPRAATIVAIVPTTTWWIDRDTYRGLLMMQTFKKRDRYLKFLSRIDLFSGVEDYEKMRVADVLETLEVPAARHHQRGRGGRHLLHDRGGQLPRDGGRQAAHRTEGGAVLRRGGAAAQPPPHGHRHGRLRLHALHPKPPQLRELPRPVRGHPSSQRRSVQEDDHKDQRDGRHSVGIRPL